VIYAESARCAAAWDVEDAADRQPGAAGQGAYSHAAGVSTLFERPDTGVEKAVQELGGKITVLVAEGEGHFPLSRKDPKPVVDFILSHQR